MSAGWSKERTFAGVGTPGTVRLYLDYTDPSLYTEIPISLAIKYRDDINDAILNAAGQKYIEMLKLGEIKE